MSLTIFRDRDRRRHRRRAGRHHRQPAGERRLGRHAAGAVRGDRPCGGDEEIVGVVDHRRGKDLRRRGRYPRIRQADGRAAAAATDQPHRGKRKAGRGGDQRRGARRRAGDRARLPPSHRVAGGEARPARGEARHRARRRRHAAPAAARRRRRGGGDGRDRAHGRSGRGAQALGIVDAVAEGDLVAQAIAAARDLAGKPPRRTGDLPVPAMDAEAFDKMAAKVLCARARAGCARRGAAAGAVGG